MDTVMAANSMVPGISVDVLGSLRSLQERLNICSGTRPAAREDYKPTAILPTLDWRPLTPAEAELLSIGAKNLTDAEAVSVIKLPSEVSDELQFIRLAIAKHNKRTVVDNLMNHPKFRAATRRMLAICSEVGVDDVKILGHYFNPPGSDSSSLSAENKYVGLHVDSWNSNRVSARGEGYPARLSINLAPEPRFLQFINLSLRQIAQVVDYTPSDHPNEFVRQFLSRYPNYPVLKLAIHPGEAYICPTETVIHDGTLRGRTYFDAQVTLLGSFRPQHRLALHQLN
jgi:hypothetical protein